MPKLKGQTESGEWVEFCLSDIETLLVRTTWFGDGSIRCVDPATIRLADESVDLMLDEVLRLLNDREPGEALEVFRKHYGLINAWQCQQCGGTSSHYSSQSVCEKCGSPDITMAVVLDKDSAAKYRTGEADEIRSTMLNRITALTPGGLLPQGERQHYRLAVDDCKDMIAAIYNTPADDPRKSKWINKDRNWRDYPVGTKARESWGNGGHWTKTDYGWKWCTGSTFPTPGGADQVMLPADDPRKAMLNEIRERVKDFGESNEYVLVATVNTILDEMEAKL